MAQSTKERWLTILPPRADTPDGVSYFEAGRAFRGRPYTRVEACVARYGEGYDWLIALRLMVGERPAAWAHVDDWWSNAEIALADAPDGAGIIPHIRSSDVETTEDWTSWFRDQLTGPTSPLYPGLWQLADFPRHRSYARYAYSARPPRESIGVPWPASFETEVFDDIVPTRTASAPESGRVKWYRKLARQQKLPPVLLMYCAPMLEWLVLDGHDRLLAAALEGVQLRYVGLSAVERHPIPVDPAERATVEESLAANLARRPGDQRAIEGVNGALIALYEDSYMQMRQRVWPTPGGTATWAADVRRLAETSDDQVIQDMVEAVPERYQ